jgi:uncharacterized protein involved in type VI secretion and phage assembly
MAYFADHKVRLAGEALSMLQEERVRLTARRSQFDGTLATLRAGETDLQ